MTNKDLSPRRYVTLLLRLLLHYLVQVYGNQVWYCELQSSRVERGIS